MRALRVSGGVALVIATLAAVAPDITPLDGISPASAAQACSAPPGFTPRGRLESGGVVLLFRTLPATIALGQHFSVDALICAESAALTRVDAQMPEHRHGMNYRPTIAAKGDGRYVAEGLMFHMPGRWEFSFDVETAGRRTRLATDVIVE